MGSRSGLFKQRIYGGQVLFERFNGEKSAKLQGYVFGGSMAAVALFLAVTV